MPSGKDGIYPVPQTSALITGLFQEVWRKRWGDSPAVVREHTAAAGSSMDSSYVYFTRLAD